MYPTDRNLGLLFERLDKNEDTRVHLEEFREAITPFLQGLQQKWFYFISITPI